MIPCSGLQFTVSPAPEKDSPSSFRAFPAPLCHKPLALFSKPIGGHLAGRRKSSEGLSLKRSVHRECRQLKPMQCPSMQPLGACNGQLWRAPC